MLQEQLLLQLRTLLQRAELIISKEHTAAWLYIRTLCR